MSAFSHFYLSYISLSSIIVVIFMAFLAIFYIQVAQKSEPTKWLMIFFNLMVVFYAPYITGAFYDPVFAYHRWLTVAGVLIAAIAIAHFIMRFPHMTHPRMTYGLMVGQYLVNVPVIIYFLYASYGAPTVFKFSGHYWDFDLEKLSRMTGLVILLNILLAGIFGIWKAIVIKKIRWVMLGVIFSYILATFVPGFTNVLSRSGTVSRELHQTVISAAVIVGFFTLTMVFINTTRDRTTFMAKIIGISFATFMLMMAPIAWIGIEDKEDSYDRIFQHEAYAIIEGDKIHPDFRYWTSFDLQTKDLQFRRNSGDLRPRLDHIQPEFVATWYYALVQSLRQDQTMQTAAALAERMNEAGARLDFPYAVSYRDLILHINKDLEIQPGQDRPSAILEVIDARYRRMLTLYNKTAELGEDEFAEKAESLLAGVKEADITWPMAQAGLQILTQKSAEAGTSPTAAPADLKQSVLDCLVPMRSPGERHYRYSTQPEQDGFVGFMHVDLKQNRVDEVGFSYLRYRAFIHVLAIKLLWIILAVSLVVILGYRVFFSGALLRPLESLLDGVRQVNAGDLDVHVPIQVQDEIGFLARSFNGMVSSIREAQIKLKDYAENLEDKVRLRTEELKNSLEHVQALKTQQDGDYFLTSLLTKPLNANYYQGETINVDFLISQKKKFEFRNRQDELGGDMCSAHRVKLKGRDYLVFMNADAMGKSIQGAGGVLVLGSVFESMIMRTMLSERASNYYPERWLKNAFVELHKVFEAFDGSMLISVVFGLLEEDTGFLYYINAEHPYSVSYYKGTASFLDTDILFRKLGTIGLGRGIHVLTHQLRPGEVFIAGSDGRDDILIGHTEAGDRIINEDEELFLAHVEKSDGHLVEIEKRLLDMGELTDDLSLLRIEFIEPLVQVPATISKASYSALRQARELAQGREWDAALEKLDQIENAADRNHPHFIKERAGILFKLKRYEDALTLTLEYLGHISADTGMIYLCSLLYKRLRQLDDAADYGERLRLRQPEHADNLVNLADIYHHMGQTRRSRKILNEALRYDPQNNQARRLKAALNY
ncbi:MAG: SpoIIE family protein phosphatase [Leptospiraceae bacterium]|nr:SpoIIE family protein phosphatase [Leptospiraceae bacterium]